MIKTWYYETNEESEADTVINNLQQKLHNKVVEKYHNQYSNENDSFSLELVQLFSFRSIITEYQNYADVHAFLLFRKRVLLVARY